MKKNKLILPMLVVVALVTALSVPTMLPTNQPKSIEETLHYNGFVCTQVTTDVGIVLPEQCHHNLLTNVGKNMMKSALGQGGVSDIVNITVANFTSAAAQAATDRDLTGAWSSCGMGPAVGTFNNVSLVPNPDGQWNITYQWTSTCDNIIVNATGLYNRTGAGLLFAEATFAVTDTLQTNYKYNVTWGLQTS